MQKAQPHKKYPEHLRAFKNPNQSKRQNQDAHRRKRSSSFNDVDNQDNDVSIIYDRRHGVYIRRAPLSPAETASAISVGTRRVYHPVHGYVDGPSVDPNSVPLAISKNLSSSNRQQAEYSMTLGGQVPHPDTNRLPSTFLTPTNTNTYAISSRGHIISSRPVVSHHATVHNATPHNIFESKPVVRFSTDIKEDSELKKTPKKSIPGIPFSFEWLDAHLDHPGHRTSSASKKARNELVMRRSATWSVDMPSQLAIKEIKVDASPIEAAPIAGSPTGRQISEGWVVAAFDGVHKHLEDVKEELSARLDCLEEKLDHVLAVVSAGAEGAGGAGGKGKKNGKKGEKGGRREEFRGNLVGQPPHIPLGGMEGWYSQVKK